MEQSVILRCHNDSSHYVGVKYFKKRIDVVDKPSIRNYVSEYTKTYGNSNEKKSDKISNIDLLSSTLVMDDIYPETFDLKEKARFSYMKSELKKLDLNVSDDKVKEYFKKKDKLLYARLDRFRKKALNNRWNYFVTITYDDKKHDEISFKEKLKKCLSNLHVRDGYKYMGVFERSESGRLHFHALFYIPKGAIKGEINEVKDYSTSDKKMRVSHVNSFFEKRFGRNDFVPISNDSKEKSSISNYILKYITKSNDKIFYSRGIATYLFIQLKNEDEEKYIICNFGEFVKYYILFDDVNVLDSDLSVKLSC